MAAAPRANSSDYQTISRALSAVPSKISPTNATPPSASFPNAQRVP